MAETKIYFYMDGDLVTFNREPSYILKFYPHFKEITEAVDRSGKKVELPLTQTAFSSVYENRFELVDGVLTLGKSAKEKQQEQNQQEIVQLEQYLASTDWYAIRYADIGTPIPDEIKNGRKKARERISELRGD